MKRIAVDAMGGDEAPRIEVSGVLAALRDRRDLRVILVGDRDRLELELLRRGRRIDRVRERLELRHASQVITMSDHPGAAVRGKKDSSMRVCFDLVRAGEADAVVSAGNSGAVLACGLLVWRRLKGVDRPGIVTICPTRDGRHAVVLDVGANTEVRPATLAQYGVMGAAYARLLLGVPRPRVALLSNGEEETKGTALTREAHRLLGNPELRADFDFVGYVEGRDIFSGLSDVIVTDGFTGNVALKTTEGVARFIVDMLKAEAARSLVVRLGALLMKPAFEKLKRRLGEEQYGGAPLVGVDGVAIVCHGRSTPRAIQNAIYAAARFVHHALTPAIADAIARHRGLWQADANESIASNESVASTESVASNESVLSNQSIASNQSISSLSPLTTTTPGTPGTPPSAATEAER